MMWFQRAALRYLSTIQTKPYLEIFRVSWLLADREMSTWRSQRVGWWYLFLQMVSTQKLEYHKYFKFYTMQMWVEIFDISKIEIT